MSRIRNFTGLAAAVLLVGAASLAQAQNWTGATGDWTVGGNWSTGSQPTTSQTGTISNGGNATITAPDNVNPKVLVLGGTNGTYIGSLTMYSGSLNAAAVRLGFAASGKTASGTFTQYDGVNYSSYTGTSGSLSVGYNTGGTGVYNLIGGSVNDAVIYVGQLGSATAAGQTGAASGTFNQTGGSIGSISSPDSSNAVALYVGGENANSVVAQGTGTFNLGNASPSNPSSALLVGGVEYVGVRNNGIFNQTGGTNAIYGGVGSGGGGGSTYPDNADGALVLGFYAPFSNLSIATPAGNGTYNLSGGLLTGDPNPAAQLGGYEFVGVGGVGTFNHTGGTNSCNVLSVGSLYNILATNFAKGSWSGGGIGTYNLGPGVLLSQPTRAWPKMDSITLPPRREFSTKPVEPTPSTACLIWVIVRLIP